ncbi:multiubiquitin [Frondihabitans sp. PhB188]|uniref:multiubiquitin domain-containing protein n=1 Tax=Frondihabitans sp. PhB188 TaxID=2485200 RepID=UPI000F488182|nr:multiubiquitin domain-containing protein [Frondihabitans sp. PhB188]ROQ30272.1 multiubiquitin [Frondihabitans sp. PhB188]
MNSTENNHPDSLVTIFIDGTSFTTKAGMTTVDALRHLPNPHVPADKNLWLDILDEQDRLLEHAETIEIRDGMRFFTEIPSVTIKIDRHEYEVFKRKMAGAELRVVPSPDVAADRDLWLDVPDKRDVKVQDEDVIELHAGIRFFTAPGRINPGSNLNRQ